MSNSLDPDSTFTSHGVFGWLIRFFIENRLIAFLLLVLVVTWGVLVAPFDWDIRILPRSPVPVDAIPDIGENQQIVFTEWSGRSPYDVDNQVTYPLTVSLLGVPGVRTVRSLSMFGFSIIYIIFDEQTEFYWSRSRIIEKLDSFAPGTLPTGVRPTLGPDATSLGQVFWYTLEGRDESGAITGGWDLEELRSIQDWYVRYGLMSAEGVAEVASVGGYVKEYQIDVDPAALRHYGVSLEEVVKAVRMTNLDVGARTIEVNQVEYVVRGVGFITSLDDIRRSVVLARGKVPIYLEDVANITTGPALRRGALDKEGTEVVGGVVVVRYGENPMETIKNVKAKIHEISSGLPKKILADGTESTVTIVPFYDRTGLITETLGTLSKALSEEILITVAVIIALLLHLGSSFLISTLLPVAVLMAFIAMKLFGIEANIVALSGIAIAIGTIVDMGIVVTENIVRHLGNAEQGSPKTDTIHRAVMEVAGAVTTAIATTVVSFLPVFTMQAAEGKLFKPLAYTKTFALVASVVVALLFIPPFARFIYGRRINQRWGDSKLFLASMILGFVFMFVVWWIGLFIVLIFGFRVVRNRFPGRLRIKSSTFDLGCTLFFVLYFLTREWMPLGYGSDFSINLIFVVISAGSVIGLLRLFQRFYLPILRWSLDNKRLFFVVPMSVIILGAFAWMGFDGIFGWLPVEIREIPPLVTIAHVFPGLSKEFMPSLDEGSFLFMPTTMPHASMGEALDVLSKQDRAITAIPEIETAVGKIGRVDSPLDPAPISMVETIINYKPEYMSDERGYPLKFRFDSDSLDFMKTADGIPALAPDGEPYRVRGIFIRGKNGKLIPDRAGKPFRNWRLPLEPELNNGRNAWPGINSPDDIWHEIEKAARLPGTTSAPKLQPIETRIVMLQSGMRAPMGIKIRGSNLDQIERVGLRMEQLLKEVPSIEAATVFADRIIGKPYIEIVINRESIARYGIHLSSVQNVIEIALGGMSVTTTVEGRERYVVRVRYLRELRDRIESLGDVLVSAPGGIQIPLRQLADIKYLRGPQVIKSEDTFLVGYVTFDKKQGYSEIEVVEDARSLLNFKREQGELHIPNGVNYVFSGSYENQIRAQRTLSLVLPLALFVIFLILYLQFRRISTSLFVFSGILVAWSGGFILIWLYGKPWFLDLSILGIHMRELFQIQPIHLSVAVWVGFLALFGIASDGGVVMATYLDQTFKRRTALSIAEIREATIDAAMKRVRPALMTTATTLLALLPILTSTGRGSDIMVPMAIPSFGGMLLSVITLFVVPVLYCARVERDAVTSKTR